SLPVLPFRPTDRLDIVSVDYVGSSIVTLHQKEKPEHEVYHLSSGTASQTYEQLTSFLARAQGKSRPVYLPWMEKPFRAAVNRLANMRNSVAFGASLLKVFLPYLVWNTVFDNTRVVS